MVKTIGPENTPFKRIGTAYLNDSSIPVAQVHRQFNRKTSMKIEELPLLDLSF